MQGLGPIISDSVKRRAVASKNSFLFLTINSKSSRRDKSHQFLLGLSLADAVPSPQFSCYQSFNLSVDYEKIESLMPLPSGFYTPKKRNSYEILSL